MTNRATEFINKISSRSTTQVHGDDLIEGQRIWAPGYSLSAKGYVPVELVIVDSHVDRKYHRIKVAYVNQEDRQFHAASYDYEDEASYIYLGDLGVRPYNYDKRTPQVFHTKQALESAIALWDGKNPNFLYV